MTSDADGKVIPMFSALNLTVRQAQASSQHQRWIAQCTYTPSMVTETMARVLKEIGL